MADEWPADVTDEESLYSGAYNVAADLASRSRRLRDSGFSTSAIVLDEIVNTLMTEFWDQDFSQTEIRTAFATALADMNRYAAGKERRSGPDPSQEEIARRKKRPTSG